MTHVSTVLELHISVTTQQEVDQLMSSIPNIVKAKIHNILEEFDINKHFDIFKNWQKIGPLSLTSLNNNWTELDRPGIYCIKEKGEDWHKLPFGNEAIYFGETSVSGLKRLQMFERDFRGKKSNHGGKIYESVCFYKLKAEDYEIWFRPHWKDGSYEGVDSVASSRDREEHALALHRAIFGRRPFMNTRDKPRWSLVFDYEKKLEERVKQKQIEKQEQL